MPKELIVNPKPGVLIAFEGLSGSGKSENINSLMTQLESLGYRTALSEWNSIRFFRKITEKLNAIKLLNSTGYSIIQWVGFLGDYCFKIIPRLKRNHIVIADRYIYTGLTRDLANQANQLIGNILSRLVRKPDLLFFYDIKPEVCYKRIHTRGKLLFHTNLQILKNRFLKNKDLYYLKRLKRHYTRLFLEGRYLKETNLILLKNPLDSLDYVKLYLAKKPLPADVRKQPMERKTYENRSN